MGQSWDGTGEYPDWLQRAVNAGQSIDSTGSNKSLAGSG